MINEKVRLSIGAPPLQKTLGAVFGLVFAAVGAAFATLPFVLFGTGEACPSPDAISGIPVELLPPEVRDCVAGGGWFADGFDAMQLLGLAGIPFVLVGLFFALSSIRTAGWLEGTRATVRRALRTGTVDLATAAITAGAITYRRHRETSYEAIERVPTLVARDPDSGRSITIPLHGIGMAQLPPAELRALASAIDPNPDADARTLAAQLRAMADNPLGLTAR